MPNKPNHVEDQTGDDTPDIDPAKEMPSMVEETITEGLDPTDQVYRGTHLK